MVGAPASGERPEETQQHLAELGRLTDTAGGLVVGTLTQRLQAPSPRLYLGRGKADELAALVEDLEADLVIFDESLSPAQGKNLETHLGVRVMDRAELILDIFATRARTREARLQVELAQLEYLLPRLRRMWSHLSRIRGGIGLRGPGETQLETDRRLIGTRIADLRRKLKSVSQARATRRKSRAGAFRAALVGYTNAGKSSLLAALSGTPQFVEDRLFATLDSSTRTVDLGDGFEALVTDTVGFIRKLPHHLVASFRSTLEEAREADVLLHVIDASHPEAEAQREVVMGVLEDLALHERPQILVFNKIDLLDSEDLLALRRRAKALEPVPSVFASAHRASTLAGIRDALKARARGSLTNVRVHLPLTDGRTLSALYDEAEVLERTQEGATVTVRAKAPEALIGRLRAIPGVVVEAGP
ncbi:MAG: GTPase HflX [Gemmatimonadetes bacterium]|nr:GTPase HflX [Gemmatimonadota bacterium]